MLAMITYSRLGAKVWRQVSHFEPVLARELREEEIERLDQEILHWYDSVPDEVKVRNWDKERHMASTPSYNLQRLRIWTYLRFNQVRYDAPDHDYCLRRVADGSRSVYGFIHPYFTARQASWTTHSKHSELSTWRKTRSDTSPISTTPLRCTRRCRSSTINSSRQPYQWCS